MSKQYNIQEVSPKLELTFIGSHLDTGSVDADPVFLCVDPSVTIQTDSP